MKMGRYAAPHGGLIDKQLIAQLPVSGFTQELLNGMQRPLVKYIAPGLEIIDDELVFSILLPELQNRIELESLDDPFPTFLLFASSTRVSNHTVREYDRHSAAYWKEKRLLDDRCGVYVGANSLDHADTISVVAPVGDADGTHMRFQEPYGLFGATLLDTKSEDITWACTPAPTYRLYQLVALWYYRVSSGKWKVGPDGIEGDVQDIWNAFPDGHIFSW